MPVFDFKRKVKVSVGELSNTGELDVTFSDVVRLPGNVTDWSLDNEGGKYLQILYQPNDESEELFEDLDISMSFRWTVKGTRLAEIPNKRLLQESDDEETLVELDQTSGEELIGVKIITLKMYWSDPLYVSQNIKKDDITLKVLEPMLELDPSVELSEEQQVKGLEFYPKVGQQVSDAEEAAI